MSAQHTPGPWHAHHDHGWLVVESENSDLYIKIEKGSAAQKHMPDARLIAAAPELLKALEEARQFIESELWPEHEFVVRLRALCAKAKGAA